MKLLSPCRMAFLGSIFWDRADPVLPQDVSPDTSGPDFERIRTSLEASGAPRPASAIGKFFSAACLRPSRANVVMAGSEEYDAETPDGDPTEAGLLPPNSES